MLKRSKHKNAKTVQTQKFQDGQNVKIFKRSKRKKKFDQNKILKWSKGKNFNLLKQKC